VPCSASSSCRPTISRAALSRRTRRRRRRSRAAESRPRGARQILRLSLAADRLPDEVAERLERPMSRRPGRLPGAPGRRGRAVHGRRADRPHGHPRRLRPAPSDVLAHQRRYLLQGVVEEKENRVIEVILSSVTPREMLFGKLLGLGAAGILQLAVWVTVASFASSLSRRRRSPF